MILTDSRDKYIKEDFGKVNVLIMYYKDVMKVAE